MSREVGVRAVDFAQQFVDGGLKGGAELGGLQPPHQGGFQAGGGLARPLVQAASVCRGQSMPDAREP